MALEPRPGRRAAAARRGGTRHDLDREVQERRVPKSGPAIEVGGKEWESAGIIVVVVEWGEAAQPARCAEDAHEGARAGVACHDGNLVLPLVLGPEGTERGRSARCWDYEVRQGDDDVGAGR